MPYITEWVDPEIAVEHNGVTIWRTYKNDDVEQGARSFWYTCEENGSEDGELVFDVRDLPDYTPYRSNAYSSAEEQDWHRVIMRDAIAKGHLTQEGVAAHA